MPHVVLYEPEIPPNTGNVGRLCLATKSVLHLIEPLGFDLSEKSVRRAGLDYWKDVEVNRWPNWKAYEEKYPVGDRTWFFTTKATTNYWNVGLHEDDHLIFGPETRGLPETLLNKYQHQGLCLPQPGTVRSLNLATSVGIAVYEALRPKN